MPQQIAIGMENGCTLQIIYDGDSLKIYINGIRNTATHPDIPMEIANDRIFIGKANHNEVSKFGGEMDEFRLWNYA